MDNLGCDDVAVPLEGGHVDHPGKALDAVAYVGEDELGYSFLATPGVYNPGVIWFFFLSSPPRYTFSSIEDYAVVLLLLVDLHGVPGDVPEEKISESFSAEFKSISSSSDSP